MSLLDRVKAQAEQTAVKAREGVTEVQTKFELSQAYAELGRTAFALAEKGEIAHAELLTQIERVKEIEVKLAGEGQSERE